MALKEKNWVILTLFILAGIVIGGLLGELTKDVSFLSWLAYGKDFGLSDPLVLDLGVLVLTFGLMIKINVASILGVIIAVVIYKKCL